MSRLAVISIVGISLIFGLISSPSIVSLKHEKVLQTLVTFGISLLGAGLISKASLDLFGNNPGESMIGNTPGLMICAF